MKILFYFITVVMLFAACNQDSTVGADLLGDETITVEFTDTIKPTSITIQDDPVVTYRVSTTYDDKTFLIGQLDDPIFGKSSAITYVTPSHRTAFPSLSLSMVTIDSVVLSLPLDTLGQYGDVDEVHTIRAYQLDERFELAEDQDTLFSDFCSLGYGLDPLGSTTTSVNEKDSITFFDPTVDTLVNVSARLRIPLESDVWEEIRIDKLKQGRDTIENFIKGFAITSEDVSNSLFGISLDSGSPSYIEWYYVDSTDTKRLFLMDVGASLRHNCVIHDNSGTEAAMAVDQIGQEKTYVQTMGGVITEYDFDNVTKIKDGLVNSAVLELFAETPNDEFYPGDRLIASYITDDGTERVIDDILVGDANVYFDGGIGSTVIGGETILKYNLNMTSHITSLVRGSITNTKVLIRIFPTQERPTRTIFYSPEHPEYPSQLNLVITNP